LLVIQSGASELHLASYAGIFVFYHLFVTCEISLTVVDAYKVK